MQKTIVVTGGAGFIGSHLCERLVALGHHVISLDNYFTGSEENHVPGVEYRNGHTRDIALHVTENVDLLFHLGEYSRVAPSLLEPDIVWDLNIAGSLAVFEHWRKGGYKLVYAGSSTKFAAEREDGVAGRDRAPYTWAKAANTDLVHDYGHWYGLPYAIAYFYNVYGPRERAGQFDGSYGTIVETFRQCHLEQVPCTINGDGTQTRAFTHVNDTVDALLLIAEKGEGDEYAISSEDVHSLNQLADLFGLEKTYAPTTTSTRTLGALDTTKLRALGWEQKESLEAYIAANL